jgi:hypothetical protein
MKNLLFIVLSFFMITTQAQEVKFKTFSTSTEVITLTLGSVLLNAAGDALNDNGEKGWGHTLNALSIATLLTLPLVVDESEALTTFFTYIGFRFSTFNPTYNAVRGLPLNYIGTTSFDDKLLGKLKPPDGFLFARSVVFVTTVSIPINHLNYHKPRHNKHFSINN